MEERQLGQGTSLWSIWCAVQGHQWSKMLLMHRGPELLHLVITFRVEISFTERPNRSNSMEHQLSMVK
jgi:hypothetical protein